MWLIHRAGKGETDVGIALRCARLGLGRHKMPGPRAVAFAKRLSTTALQLEHQDAAAILVELKQILRVSVTAFCMLKTIFLISCFPKIVAAYCERTL